MAVQDPEPRNVGAGQFLQQFLTGRRPSIEPGFTALPPALTVTTREPGVPAVTYSWQAIAGPPAGRVPTLAPPPGAERPGPAAPPAAPFAGNEPIDDC